MCLWCKDIICATFWYIYGIGNKYICWSNWNIFKCLLKDSKSKDWIIFTISLVCIVNYCRNFIFCYSFKKLKIFYHFTIEIKRKGLIINPILFFFVRFFLFLRLLILIYFFSFLFLRFNFVIVFNNHTGDTSNNNDAIYS